VSVYLGNAYASADALHERQMIDGDADQAMREQMVSDWEDDYKILGYNAEQAVEAFGSLEMAAEKLSANYYRALKVEAASRWVD
jgi:hypothetical protein